uniref:non-specific serine/threonine protein kinase n=1 Tax=Anas platyrhynchos TaxID=8839 RepID=A0A8B9SJC9_ANAPL
KGCGVTGMPRGLGCCGLGSVGVPGVVGTISAGSPATPNAGGVPGPLSTPPWPYSAPCPFLPAAAMAEGKIAGLYDLERTLGKGHFAVVKLARHVFTGQRVAVKVIDKSKLAGEAAGQLLQEVRCMKLVQHPNVVRLYEVIDTHSKLYLILELGDGGDMFDHIMRHEGGLAEGRAKHYFAQIVHAISYCHKLHVVHRDLKPENVVFFQEQGVVKLTDFGFSNRFQPGKMLTTSCGSLAYSAPEILLGDEYDAPAVDIWSLGVILYMLVCGQPPFQEANDSETPPRVTQGAGGLTATTTSRPPTSCWRRGCCGRSRRSRAAAGASSTTWPSRCRAGEPPLPPRHPPSSHAGC